MAVQRKTQVFLRARVRTRTDLHATVSLQNVYFGHQALELIERRFGTLPNIFASYPEDLDTSRSDASDDWSDKEDVLTEFKK